MPNRNRSVIIAEALYQIAWSAAASLVIIALLIFFSGCETDGAGYSVTVTRTPRWKTLGDK